MNPRRIIRHVLVPHDFSELADVALAFALDLMQGPDARITLLHAYELIPYAFPEVPAFTLEMGHQIEAGARAALEGIAARVRRPDVAMGIELHRALPGARSSRPRRTCAWTSSRSARTGAAASRACCSAA